MVKQDHGRLLDTILTLGKFSYVEMDLALRESIKSRSSECMMILYRHGAKDFTFNDPVLVKLCKKGYASDVDFLLERGANIEDTNMCKTTALHVAAKNGLYDCVVVLLKHSAKVNTQNECKQIPLELACKYSPQPDRIVKALIDAGSEWKIVDDWKQSLLHRATFRG